MIVIEDSALRFHCRPTPEEVIQGIGFPPSTNFSTPIPFRLRSATTLESGVKFSFSERTREMFGRGMEEEKGNGVREMQRRKEPTAKRVIGKRGRGKGAIE